MACFMCSEEILVICAFSIRGVCTVIPLVALETERERERERETDGQTKDMFSNAMVSLLATLLSNTLHSSF